MERGAPDRLTLTDTSKDQEHYDKLGEEALARDYARRANEESNRQATRKVSRDSLATPIREGSYGTDMPYDVGDRVEPYGGSGLRLDGGDSGLSLSSRFIRGAFHGALDLAYQPLAQVVDLGQSLYGLTTGGAYEPQWLSGIGQNYAGGMGYGETILRGSTGIPVVGQLLGVGFSSYDMASSALRGDWGGVAEGLGGMVGGYGGLKLTQRAFAPEAGAELGMYRNRPQTDVPDPYGMVPTLPGKEAANFNWAEPVRLSGSPLNRVFDTLDPNTRGGAKYNGGYWTEQSYTNETSWRSGVAVPENQPWNRGTRKAEWTPTDEWGWRGPAAPQGLGEGYSYSNKAFGFTSGWIQRGGDYQIWVPNSYSPGVIPPGSIRISPTPWWPKSWGNP